MADDQTPNVARVYDWLIGGNQNYAADREAGRKVLEMEPASREIARSNRAFLTRAVTWAARQGVSQFLDLGSGLPAVANTHETAQVIIPGAHVVYVDYDDVALAHSRALLASGGTTGAAAAGADLADIDAVLALAEVRDLIDRARPLGVILASVLHFWPLEEARRITAAYMAAAAPGSVLIASVGRNDCEEAYAGAGRVISRDLHNFTLAEAESLFAGLDLVPPGVVRARAWRPGWPRMPRLRPVRAYMHAGVGVKP